MYGGHFDCGEKEKRIILLENLQNNANFWNDREKAEQTIKEVNNIKSVVLPLTSLKKELSSNLDLLSLIELDSDEELLKGIEEELPVLEEKLKEVRIMLLLNGKYDNENCILEIHPGAGGTESCDWAEMLYRMYTRWMEKKGYRATLLDYQKGDEAGIKSVSILVSGNYAYGYLKYEKGIHRLVRLSPFDSNNRRHTSFASVEVTPDIKKEIDLKMDERDLKIDVFRSTGAGGQGVNTTDSAVRITHLPSKIVVTCQNERSQIQNKEHALQVLKAKLLLIEEEKEMKRINDIKGEQMEIDFGSQIRSYILHPYSLVKDHRTNEETSNTSRVLDGDIDIFIESNLKRGV